MPSVVGESVVRIGVDSSRLRSGLARAQKQTTTRIAAIGVGIKTQFAGIAASMGLLGVGAGIAGLIRSVVNFEDEMLKLAATMRLFGDADETLARLEKTARRLGGTTQFTAGQVAAALNELALGGLSAEEQIAAIEGVLQGAAAGGIDMATMAKSVAVNLSAFNLEAKESVRIVDLFASAQTKSITTMAQLIEAMRGVAPVAASANLKINDTTAILATLAKTGLVGAEAGTSLGVAFTRLLLPSKEAKKVLKAAGFAIEDFSDAAGNIIRPIEMFERLAQANFTVAQGLEIFGARGRKFLGFLNTIRNTSDGTTNALRRIRDEITADTGIAGKQAAKRMSGTTGALKTMISALQELGISVLPPLIQGFVAFLEPLLKVVRELSKLNELLGGAIGKFIAMAAAVLTATVALTAMRAASIALFVAINKGLISTGFGAIAVAIGLAILGIIELVGWIRSLESVQAIAAETTKKWGLIWENVKASFNAVMIFMIDVFNEFVSNVLGAFGIEIGDTLDGGIAGWITSITDFILDASQSFRVMAENTGIIWDIISTAAEGSMFFMLDVWTNLVNNMKVLMAASMDAIVAKIKTKFDEIVTAVQLLSDVFVNLGVTIASALSGDFEAAASAARRTAKAAAAVVFELSGTRSDKAAAKAFTAQAKNLVSLTKPGKETKEIAVRQAANFAKLNKKFSELVTKQSKLKATLTAPGAPGGPDDGFDDKRGGPRRKQVRFEAALSGIQEFNANIQQTILDTFNKNNDVDAKILDTNKKQEALLEQLNETAKKQLEKGQGFGTGGVAA